MTTTATTTPAMMGPLCEWPPREAACRWARVRGAARLCIPAVLPLRGTWA